MKAWRAASDPIEVLAAVINHFFGQISAVGGIAHQGGFLEDDASAAERIEDGASLGVGGGEIDKNLSKFGR